MTKASDFFSFWIDADSCPVQVRDIIIRFALRLEIKTFYVANHLIPIPNKPNFFMITTDNTPDAADNYIVENAGINDIIITRDIPLAHRLVSKSITVINDRGVVYTAENISERLSLRNFNLDLFQLGLCPEKTNTFGKKEVNNFANSFDREIQKKLKASKL